MTVRLFFLFNFLTVFYLSGYWLQSQHGFYFQEQESWKWALDYFMANKMFPEILIKQFFYNMMIVLSFNFAFVVWYNKAKSTTLFGRANKKSLHGSASFASIGDVKKAGLLSKTGVIVGGIKGLKNKVKPLIHNGAEHVFCFAPTGSGKGVSLVLPTLLSWQENALVLDIKGENYEKTAGYRKSIGQKTLKFDPSNNSGAGASFNPLSEIRKGTDYEIQDIQNIAEIIIDKAESKNADPFWKNEGCNWLTAGIAYTLYKIKDRETNLWDVAITMSTDLENLINDMLIFEAKFNGLVRKDVTYLINTEAQSMSDKAEATSTSVHSAATSKLKLYKDPIIAKNTRYSDFKVKDLIDKDNKISVYLVINPDQIDRTKPLIKIILNIVLKKLTAQIPAPESTSRLLLMLDEFTSLGKIEVLETTLAYMRGYGLKAYIIVQDLKQLQNAYGRHESIISNCHIRTAFAPNKIETAEVLSKMSGKTTIISEKQSVSKNTFAINANVSTSIQEVGRPLLTADECMQLPGAVKSRFDEKKVVKGGDMLIFPAGFKPIYGKQYLYFQDKEMLKKSQIKIESEVKAKPLPEESSEPMEDKQKTMSQLLLKGVKNT